MAIEIQIMTYSVQPDDNLSYDEKIVYTHDNTLSAKINPYDFMYLLAITTDEMPAEHDILFDKEVRLALADYTSSHNLKVHIPADWRFYLNKRTNMLTIIQPNYLCTYHNGELIYEEVFDTYIGNIIAYSDNSIISADFIEYELFELFCEYELFCEVYASLVSYHVSLGRFAPSLT